MAFYNAVVRDYSPETGRSEILCRVWICSLSDLKKMPKSWFLSFNGKLIKRFDVDKRMMAKFTLLTPVHIYCRPRERKQYPILVNLEFFSGGGENAAKMLNRMAGITVDVEEGDTVEVLKRKVENVSGIPSPQQRLIYAGAQLKDRKTIKDYGIRMEEVVHVVDGVRRGIGGGGGGDEEEDGLGRDDEEEEKKEGNSCVVCDRKRVGLDEFVVDCGHYYHACCLPVEPVERVDRRGCVICDVELLAWSEALEFFSDEGDIEKKVGGERDEDKMAGRLLQAPPLLRNEDDEDEGIEVDFTAVEAIQYSEDDSFMSRLQKWKEYDEFYFLIAAIVIPMFVGSTMGSFWGAMAGLGMIEVLRRRNLGDGNNNNIE